MTEEALNNRLSEIWPRRWPRGNESNGFTGFKGARGQILCTQNDYKQVTFHMPLYGTDEEIFRSACEVIRTAEAKEPWVKQPPRSSGAIIHNRSGIWPKK